MSGAAGIAAAKNRRSKPDPSRPPTISCSSKSGSCPLPSGNKKAINQPIVNEMNRKEISPNDVVENNLQITTPMHFMQVISLHEQRLNRMDNKLTQFERQSFTPMNAQDIMPQASITQLCESQACDEECYDRISALEEKVKMLEEVIMNLQLTLTNVQNFAMETSLAMLKIQNQTQPTTPLASIIEVVPSTNVD
jgi:carboxypeptidase C (cathepsin A)